MQYLMTLKTEGDIWFHQQADRTCTTYSLGSLNLGRLEEVNTVFNFPAEKPLMKTVSGAHMEDTVNFGGGID